MQILRAIFGIAFVHLVVALGTVSAEPACLAHTFERHETFGESYDLFWTVDKARREISLCMQAATQGWVAFGLSQTGGMVGADIFRGYFDEEDEPHLDDYWSTAFAKPEKDITQDWDLLRAHRNATHTGFHGRRPLESCDDEDHAFTALPNNIIWAFGRSDDFTQHWPEDRGGGTVSFFVKEAAGLDGELVVDLVGPKDVTIPAEKTLYYCAFVPIPVEPHKRFHITSYELLPDQSIHMHHENGYRCAPGTNERFGAELNTFFDCRDAMPDDCSLSLAAATGMKKINGWSEAGIPAGGTDADCADPNDFRCFRLALLEVHFENKFQPLRPIVDPILGFRLYMTEKLRENDIGVMKVAVPQNAISVPPGQKEYVVSAECGAECTSARMTEPLNLLLIAPHMHKIGFSYVLHHVRDGEAIGEYGSREYGWTDTITAMDVINARLLPGDRLVLECGYDSTSRTEVTEGGKRRVDEMCDAYIAVYPFNPGLSACLSAGPSAPDKQYCGPADRRFWEGKMSAQELGAFAEEVGHPLLPFAPAPFTRLDDLPRQPTDLCAAVARYRVSDPQDARAIVVGPAIVILGYLLVCNAAAALLARRSPSFRAMSDPNQRNVAAYIADTLVCLLVLAAVAAYDGWRKDPRAVIDYAGPISAVAANVLLWTYIATLVFRSKVHPSTVCHHLATVAVIFLCNIAAYQHGAEQYNKIGAVMLLMAASDAPGYVALLLHRFQSPRAAGAFLACAVWNAASKAALFGLYWRLADVYPGRIRSFLEPGWTGGLMQPVMRTAVSALFLLQCYQTWVFSRLYLRLRVPDAKDGASAGAQRDAVACQQVSVSVVPGGNDEPALSVHSCEDAGPDLGSLLSPIKIRGEFVEHHATRAAESSAGAPAQRLPASGWKERDLEIGKEPAPGCQEQVDAPRLECGHWSPGRGRAAVAAGTGGLKENGGDTPSQTHTGSHRCLALSLEAPPRQESAVSAPLCA